MRKTTKYERVVAELSPEVKIRLTNYSKKHGLSVNGVLNTLILMAIRGKVQLCLMKQ